MKEWAKRSMNVTPASVGIHQVSASVRGTVKSSSEQVWTGLQSWLQDVTGRGHCARGDRDLYVRPVQRGAGLYSEVQCILGSGDREHLLDKMTDWQTDTTENITFPQLRRWAQIMEIDGTCH